MGGQQERMDMEQAGSSRAGASPTFNVLWPGGETAAASVRTTVLKAAALLRRLGVDVRMRMPQPGTPQAEAGHRWADTVLLLDDAHDPAAPRARLDAVAAAAEHVFVYLTGRGRTPAGPLPASSAQVVVLNSPDEAALAAAWLPLAERGASAEATESAAAGGVERSRRLFRPISARSGTSGEDEGHDQPGDNADDHADGRVTQQ